MSRKRPSNITPEPESGPPGGGQIVLYQTEDGRQRIEVRLEGQTVWLTQAAMAELFQTTIPNINIHLKRIYAERELAEEATIKDYLIVRSEGRCRVERRVRHYNLEAIIAVGYRVRSHRGTQFRQWATEHLREFIVKGFVLDDERLSEPGGIDYFDELLERNCLSREQVSKTAAHLLQLVRDNGSFILRNALAISLALDIEDGELGF